MPDDRQEEAPQPAPTPPPPQDQDAGVFVPGNDNLGEFIKSITSGVQRRM